MHSFGHTHISILMPSYRESLYIFAMGWFWGHLWSVWHVDFTKRIIFPYHMGCLYMIGYKLLIHEIMPFDVFIFILPKKEKEK